VKSALCLGAILATVLAAGCSNATESIGGPTAIVPPETTFSERTLEVAPSRVECTGVAEQMCLQVREAPDAPWTSLHAPIAGFDYEPGFLYSIRIREESDANPAADSSSINRTLVSILSRTRAVLPLAGPTWRLRSIDGRDALADVRVTAVFGDDTRVSGSAGCNRYSGSAVAEAGKLSVGVLATTRMYCGDVVMRQEDAYLSALGKAVSYRVAGSELHLGPGAGVVTLIFRAE
jgi:heat shock protein HslJ